MIGHEDGLLRVFAGGGPTELAGWPQQVGSAIDSTPAVADLNRDGRKEIIVGYGSTVVPNQQGGLVVYNANGSVHCRFRTADYQNIWTGGPPDGYGDGVFSSPAIGDINGDGYPDIVFGGFDLHVYALDRNCNVILSDMVEDTVWSSPALYDVTGDGRLDILIGGDQSPGGLIDWRGGEFRAITWSRTEFPPLPPHTHPCIHCVELWKHQIGDTVWSSPAVGDIDGDGRPEVVVGAGDYFGAPDGHRIWAWHVNDGSPVPGWPVTTAGSTMPSPALGDLNGDGIPEVVASSADGYVRAYHGNGALMWATREKFLNSPGGPAASPIIADLNGDGQNDVGAGNDFAYFLLDGQTGAIMSEVNTWLAHESAGAVGYFGTAGWRLVVDGFNTPNHQNSLQVYTIPAPRTPPPWPMFRRDPTHVAGPVGKDLLPAGYCRRASNPIPHPSRHSSAGYWVAATGGAVYALDGAPAKGNVVGRAHGAAVAITATRSGNGYWVLDAAGDIFSFGDARSYGALTGDHLNAPIISMAATPSGRGYWLLGADGGIFGFGDARFHGSTGNMHLNAPIIAMTATSSGRGYWLLARDGGIFGFGDARFHGSTGGLKLNAPIISMAAAPDGRGYWLLGADGGIFGFGVPFYGSVPGSGLCQPAVVSQIRPSLTGQGYFVLGTAGHVFGFGDARVGAPVTLAGYNAATDMAIRR